MPRPHKIITRIPLKAISPHATELALRCESCEKAAKYADVGMTTMYNIVVYRKMNGVQIEIARKILDALMRKRREDRARGKVSQQYVHSRKLQSIIEERMERDWE